MLDGWWAEAYDGHNGFAIGTGRTHSSMDVHDSRDGDDLYRVLRMKLSRCSIRATAMVYLSVGSSG